MCQVGDIIVIEDYKDHGKELSRHSFVVLNDEHDQIEGLDYDFVCNVMSSFKTEEQKKKKMSYPGNFPFTYQDEEMKCGNSKEGYIKAEQLYYFSKEKTSFRVIGHLEEDTFSRLIDFIENLGIPMQHVIDNL